MNFYNNFVKLCNSVGKSPSRVVLEIGGTKSAITRWKNGSTPTDATAMKIAEYFGVSIEELTGEATIGDIAYEVCRDNDLVESPFKKEEKSTVTEDDGLSESHKQLFELVKDLTEEQAKMMLRQGELLLLLMEKRKGDSER